MTQLRVASLGLIEDGAPPIVRCAVFDAAGVRHEFVAPTTTARSHTVATAPPKPGTDFGLY